jgi:nicotinate-nucleotide--dimethylbenzimidazole phosphoribosyltransferase
VISSCSEYVGPFLRDLPAADNAARAAVDRRAADILRPAGAFARLDEIASWLASWQRTDRPRVLRPAAIVFAADHGVVAEGVSSYPSEVTRAVHDALRERAATGAVMARALEAELVVVDVGIGRPTGNIVREAALSTERFVESFDAGRSAVAGLQPDLLVLGDMGIGNTTAAAAVCALLFGLGAEDWTGRGAGIDDAGYERKLAAVEAARSRVADVSDPIEVLRQVSGAELVALAGAAVEARMRSIPVVLDGFVVASAVAPLELTVAGVLDHCLAGHCSAEPGHRLLLDKLGKRPLLDLELRLGEGSGGLLAVPLIRMAAACVTEVATFAEWGIARPP